MRQPRIKGQGQSFYHCVSRVVDGRFLFQTQGPGSVEAEYFVHLMRRLEKACCVQVLTYALMSNHFHILCKVPAQRSLTDQELLDCIELSCVQLEPRPTAAALYLSADLRLSLGALTNSGVGFFSHRSEYCDLILDGTRPISAPASFFRARTSQFFQCRCVSVER
jgi:hypothetical protein